MKNKSMKFMSLAICAGLIVSNLNGIKVNAWVGSDHQNMAVRVNKSSAIMKLASSYSDEKYSCVYETKALHGYQDYVGTLIYIYTVAVKIKNSNQSPEIALNEAINVTPYPSQGQLTIEQKNVVKNAIKSVCRADLNGEEMTNKNYSKKVMGLALHLAGDVYAHRTMVPKNAVTTDNRFSSSDEKLFTNWDEFESEVKKGDIEFYKITSFLIDKKSSKFEDNIKFYSSRYEVGTEYLSAKLVEGYNNNLTFNISWFATIGDESGFNMRLNSFDLYSSN